MLRVNPYLKILNTTKYVCGTMLTIGIVIFLYGIFTSGFNAVAGIGIGTVIGSVFIFIMGLFLVTTEEMLKNGR